MSPIHRIESMSASKGECWPGIKTIAADLGLSKSSVKRAIADLEKHGYIEKEYRCVLEYVVHYS